jgi:type I restriction enzyme M protein
LDDNLPAITNNFIAHNSKQKKLEDHLGFSIAYEDLNNHIFIPEYYNPEIRKELEKIKNSGKYSLISVGELIDKVILQIRRGNEIGSQFYGTGEIPFVRTSDIVNWEIKFDPIKAVSEEIYNQYKQSQDIQEKDILFVNDGTFLIGRTAMVTKLDLRIIIQSHVKKIRVLDKNFIDPYYLFYLLNSKVVRKQIDSKTFVQATISTIGNRLREIILPISNDKNEVKKIVDEIRNIIEEKAKLREKTVKIVVDSV